SLALESGGGRQRSQLRILLAHNSTYFPSHGGGDRSNRLLMEALAARAHSVRVVARVEHFGRAAEDRFLHELNVRSIAATVQDGVARFMLSGVEVHTLTENPHIRKYLERQIENFDPDVIV